MRITDSMWRHKKNLLSGQSPRSGLFTGCLFLFLSCIAFSVFADSHSIGVLYPEIREPYRSVFASIVKGIEAQAGGQVAQYPLGKDVDLNKLRAWVAEKHIKVIIALGRRSASAGTDLQSTVPVVTGAVQMSPDHTKGSSGVVLNPDPEILFRRLKLLTPTVKQISVIFNPQKNNWLIERARRAASSLGLDLKTYPATDLRAAAKVYREVLNKTSGKNKAIWLLNERSVLDQKAVFPLVLKSAWENEFVVFSNNPAHVKRGALFAMFPDNEAMGKSLAKIALQRTSAAKSGAARMLPLSDLLIAFNLRTAEHLDLVVDRKQRDRFDLVFPHR